MSVRLESFEYRFTVTGTQGGLQWCSATFVPVRPAEEDTDPALAAMRDVANRCVGILDRLFAEGILAGEKQPVFNDGFGSGEVGYQYKGSCRRTLPLLRASDRAARLSEMFGIPDPDMRGGSGRWHVPRSASVTVATGTKREAAHDPEVAVRWSFNHRLNVCLYRFMLSLDGVEISERAAGEMALLDRNLALDWDKAGQDWFRTLLQDGAAFLPGRASSP